MADRSANSVGVEDAAEDAPSETKYTMRLSRLTVEKLGIKLYDRVSAVLAELIANAHDADATHVKVSIPFDQYLAVKSKGVVIDQELEIRIEDDGHGMTETEVNDFYLRVGDNRRSTRGETSPRGRPVMGRKGIGKLSPFGICRVIEVISAGSSDWGQEGPFRVANLILCLDDIMDESKADDDYHPNPGPLDGTLVEWRGTRIILRMFERRRVPSAADLTRQLAARFGIEGQDWRVDLSDPRSNENYTLGRLNIPLLEDTSVDVASVPLVLEGEVLPVTGWVGYATTSYRDDAMAGIRILARGKIVAQTRDFDIRSGFTGEYKMRAYIVGEITADWLDDAEDLVQSDRQDIIWNSDQGQALQEWGQRLIRDLAARAETTVTTNIWRIFSETSDIEARLKARWPKDARMRDSISQAAKVFVGRSERDAIESDPNYRERIIDLAYSIGPHHQLMETLREVAQIDIASYSVVAGLFEKARVVEFYSLGQLASERVEVLDRLERLIETAETQELELQSLAEGAPWILNPTWTPLSSNSTLEMVRRRFEQWYQVTYKAPLSTTTIDRPTKRPDFVMIAFEGALQIIEIKRPDHSLTDEEYNRAFGYLKALVRFLNDNPTIGSKFTGVHLTIVCDKSSLSDVSESSLGGDKRIIRRTWQEIVDATFQAHRDFVDRVREMQTESSVNLGSVPEIGQLPSPVQPAQRSQSGSQQRRARSQGQSGKSGKSGRRR